MTNGPRVVPIRPKKPPPSPPPGAGKWWQALARDERGRIISDLDNVMIALRGADEMAFGCTWDEMLRHSIVSALWPKVPEAEAQAAIPHETTDLDITQLQQWLQRMGLRRIGRETVGQAVEYFASERSRHPVREWLDSLLWDGVPRLKEWMFRYLGAQADDEDEVEYVAAIGEMFLIGMVARIMKPGCQMDYMLVLEGEQGVLKSSACRTLAGEWFSEGLPENISGKDARQHLRGKWLIEVSELAAFTKAETEALKAFITRREEQYRPPFGRHEVSEKRQCVFVGTTNQDTYIKDPTGGRRFWPVKCSDIDVDGLTRVREHLFAEAVCRFNQGVPHWPDPEFERRFFKPQQEKRQDDDPWTPPIHAWTENSPLSRITVSQLARECLGFDGDSRIGTIDQRRIANILKDLGWKMERTKHGRYYVRPKSG